jgi:1,2-diacylglycerol 3-alpha-glucosyltransferase
MHIGHFTNTYFPTISGVVRQVSALRKIQLEQGHQVSVFTQSAPGFKDQELQIFRYPTLGFSLPMDFPAIIPFSPQIDQRLPGLKLDIIHIHHPFVLGQVALSQGRRLGLPVVFTFHTRYWEHSHFFPVLTPAVQELAKAVINERVRRFLKCCHIVIVYTETLRKLLVRTYDECSERIRVVPTGIDLAPFQCHQGTWLREELGWKNSQVLISVGRLSLEKNWMTLIEAARQVTQTHHGFRLALIGDGPQRGELEQYVQKMGMNQCVEFLGRLDFDQIPMYLQAADLFGFASTTETIGRVTMEAMAAGLPVIAVAAAGTSDLIDHGRNGWLTENRSSSLADGIRILLNNDQLRQKLAESAQVKAQTFNVRVEADKTLDVYYNALEEFRRTNGK